MPPASRRRNLSPWAYWSLRLRSTAPPAPIPAGAGFASWRAGASARLAALLGPDPVRVDPDVEVLGTIECEGYTRHAVVFDSEATMSVPAYLLVPHDRRAPGPAVLAIHGHGAGKSMVCGIDDGDAERRAEIDRYHGDYAHQLAAAGYVVLAPDLRCFGERRDPPWTVEVAKDDCDWNLVCAVMAGTVPLAQNLWDLRVCLDVLAAHELVDADRLAAVGLSYGATMTMFLAAVDSRVRAAVVSGYLSSWAGAHRVPWNMCGSQVLPGQLGLVEHAHVAALVAPRALLVESGTRDVLFPVADAVATVAQLRELYRAARRDDALVHDVFDGDHHWHGAQVEEFLARWLA